MTITDLIAKIESGAKPGRELDGDAALAFGLVPEKCKDWVHLSQGWHEKVGHGFWPPPPLSTSIDAILEHVVKPRGWEWFVGQHRPMSDLAGAGINGGVPAMHKEPALALLLACARAAEKEKPPCT